MANKKAQRQDLDIHLGTDGEFSMKALCVGLPG